MSDTHLEDLADRIKPKAVSNLLLWKANDHGIDPEFIDMAPANQKTITVGAHLSF